MKTINCFKVAILSLFLTALNVQAGLNLNGIASGATHPVDIELNLVGTSMLDAVFEDVLNDACDTGTLSIYTDSCNNSNSETDLSTCAATGPKVPGETYIAYFCRMSGSVSGLSSAKNVLIRKSSEFGSYASSVPLARAESSVPQMILNSTNCKSTPVSNIFKCNGSQIINEVADGGVSEIDVANFVAPNVPSGKDGIISSDLSRLTTKEVAVMMYGIPVTNKLYAALQEAQGLEKDLDSDGVFEGSKELADQEDIQANMPSLTKAQITSLFRGAIKYWSQVFYNGIPLTSVGGGIPAPSNDRVTVCRRVNGSGVQAQFNANFANVPCTDGAPLVAGDNSACVGSKGQISSLPFCTGIGSAPYASMTGTTSGQATIHEVETANDMSECLSQLNANNRWALGIQSLIKDSPNWSFIKIDGVEPTLSNAANGNYWDWVELTMQWRNTAVNGVPAPSSDELAILQYVRDNVGSAVYLNNLNMSFSQGFGKTGMLAVSVAYPFDENTPAMQYGRGGRICSPPVSKAQSIEFK